MDSANSKAAYVGGTLLAVLKVSERCNIACDYCYFFFAGDESYQQHPALIKQNTLEDLALFFQKGIAEFNLSQIQIIFHGGEPMLMGQARFDAMCSLFAERLAEQVTLLFSIQTNAMLVDEEWITLFKKHQIGIGVSLDGPREINDRHRIDKRGRGTYDRTVQGIRCLQAAAAAGRSMPIGLLCVVDPTHSAKRLYQHFVHDLGFENMDFMLPDINYETAPADLSGYQGFMLELFDTWLRDNNPKVNIRFFDKILKALGQREAGRLRANESPNKRPIVLTISSAGDIAPDDVYRSTNPGLMKTSLSVSHASLSEVVTNESIALGLALEYAIPSDCRGCTWEQVCRGGDPMHRFSRSGNSMADSFDNRSVYCEILYVLHMRISRFLLDYQLIDQNALEAGLGRSLNEGMLPALPENKQKKKKSIPLKVLT